MQTGTSHIPNTYTDEVATYWKTYATDKFSRSVTHMAAQVYRQRRSVTIFSDDPNFESYIRGIVEPQVSKILDLKRQEWEQQGVPLVDEGGSQGDYRVSGPMASTYYDFIENHLRLHPPNRFTATSFRFRYDGSKTNWFSIHEYGFQPGGVNLPETNHLSYEWEDDAYII